MPQPRSANRFCHQRAERPTGNRSDGKLHFGKAASDNFNKTDTVRTNGNCMGGTGTSSSDRLSYISTFLLGGSVEVSVTNGSIISGIFHTADVGRDFGIVLKMAHFVKDCSVKGQSDPLEMDKSPQTIIIPGNEIVQLIVKDVLTANGSLSYLKHGKNIDLMLDSAISLPCVGTMKELKPWVPPDSIDTRFSGELENNFDQKRCRNWDQFQTNAELFGVGSTFDEEVYTTKLVKGPHRKEREREASKLAREIERESTENLHLAEVKPLHELKFFVCVLFISYYLLPLLTFSSLFQERGLVIPQSIANEEEYRFSAVHRFANDSKFDLNNSEWFGCSLDPADTSFVHEASDEKIVGEKNSFSADNCYEFSNKKTVNEKCSLPSEDSSLVHEVSDHKNVDENHETSSLSSANTDLVDEVSDQKTVDEKSSSSLNTEKSLSQAVENQTDVVPTNLSSSIPSSKSLNDVSVSSSSSSPKIPIGSSESASHSTVPSSKAVDGMPASASSKSPLGSLSSEKSKLNPDAKEFKLNPDAKNFVPSSFRPSYPVSESSYSYTRHTYTTPYMPGVVGSSGGIGSSFGGYQSLHYNSHLLNMQSPQPFMQGPTMPIYGQQMYLNQPQPYMCIPGFPTGQHQYHNGRRRF